MISNAIKNVLKDGYRTKDLAAYDAKEVVTTAEMGDIIANYINK
jgi:3-isopropylmalate dehydrogenase